MTLDMYFRTKWYDPRLKETVDSLLKNDEILAKWERIKAAQQDSEEAGNSDIDYGKAGTEVLSQV